MAILYETATAAYVVGGAVRDLVLGRQPRDYDICTDLTPDQVTTLFEGKGYQVIDTGSAFGTVTVLVEGMPIEVTTFRLDGRYGPDRKPQSVTFGKNIEEDVARRDFTINAMYCSNQYLYDHYDGCTDLRFRTVACVGHPATRLQEDPLRALRAIRFAAQLNFDLEDETQQAVVNNRHLLHHVSAERIQAELNKILLSNHPAKGVTLLQDTGLLGEILPEIDRLRYFDQHNPRHNKCVFDHTMRVVEGVPAVLELRLAALFHDVGKPVTFFIDEKGVGHFYGHHKEGADIARAALRRLKYPNEVVETVGVLVYEHMARNPHFRQTGVKRLLRRVGEDRIDLLFDLMTADVAGHAPPYDFAELVQMKHQIDEIRAAQEPLHVTDLAISGADLIRLGYQPGPMFGQVLNHLLELVLDNAELNKHEVLLPIATTKLEELCV